MCKTKIKKVMYKDYDPESKQLREDTHDLSVKGGRFEIYPNPFTGRIEVFIRCREWSFIYIMAKRMGFVWTIAGIR